MYRSHVVHKGMLSYNRYGKIPFAYIAVILLLLMGTIMIPSMRTGIRLRENVIEELGLQTTLQLQDVENDIEERAYYYAMEIIRNVTRTINPDLNEIQRQLNEKMKDYIEAKYPMKVRNIWISIIDYEFKITTNIMNLTDIVNYIRVVKEREKPNVLWEDVKTIYTVDQFNRDRTLIAAYPRIDGYVHYRIFDTRRNVTITDNRTFDRNIYIPLPIVKKGIDFMRFSFSQRNGYAMRIIKYILTTLAQYRVICGVGGGGYHSDTSSGGVDNIITKRDVEIAVNLAFILEIARNFRTYDMDIARAIDNTYPSNYGKRMEDLVRDYITNGTIDAADILAIYYGYDSQSNHPIQIGKVLAQAIYSYAERFSYELFDIFWGHDATDQYHLVDPTLKEPIERWNEVKIKGEQWAKGMIDVWLDKYRIWLGIPKSLQGRSATAVIEYIVYVETPEGPVPVTVTMTWTISTDSYDDTKDFIRDSNRKKYVIHCAGGVDPPKDYEYNLVKTSLVEYHQSYSDGGPYYNTLRYIIETLDRSMTHKSDTYSNTTDKGFVDYMAYEISSIGDRTADLGIDPKDHDTIIYNRTKKIIYDQQGIYFQALQNVRSIAQGSKEQWWREGAYKQSKEGNDNDEYLYALTKETVGLWYEAIVNLWQGGIKDPGPYSLDCETFPPTYQVSTGISTNGNFNFQRDAVRDAYNRMKHTIDTQVPNHLPYLPSDLWETVKIQTYAAREGTIGNGGLINDLRAIDFMLKNTLDWITDTGTFQTQFYEFIKEKIGARIIGAGYGNNYLVYNLTHVDSGNLENSGWLDRSVRIAMFRGIYDFNDLWNNEFLVYTMVGVEYFMYHGNETECRINQSILNESFRVVMHKVGNENDHLLNDGDEITIKIEMSKDNRRLADVQHGILKDRNNENMELCDAPFETQWNISISGEATLWIETKRRPIVYNGIHQPLYYNATVQIDLAFPIVLYTAWKLESSWSSDDVKYYYTRGYFDVEDGDSFDDPHLISKPLLEYIRGLKDAVDLFEDSNVLGINVFSSLSDTIAAKRENISETLKYIYGTLKYAIDTYGNTYLSDMSSIRNRFSVAQSTSQARDQYQLRFYGMNATIETTRTYINITSFGHFYCDFELEGRFNVKITQNYGDFKYKSEIDSSSEKYRFSGEYDVDSNIDGGKYRYLYEYSMETKDMTYISLQDGDTPDIVENIYIEKLGGRRNLNIGFVTDGNYETVLRDALNSNTIGHNDCEHVVSYIRNVMRYLYEDSRVQQLTNHKIFGLYFEVIDYKQDINIRTGLILWSRDGSTLTVNIIKYYLRWIINNIRYVVYNIGMKDIHPLLYSWAYGRSVDIWENMGLIIEKYDLNEDGHMIYGNLPTGSRGVCDLGFYPTDFYVKFGYYEGDTQWRWQGTVEGID